MNEIGVGLVLQPLLGEDFIGLLLAVKARNARVLAGDLFGIVDNFKAVFAQAWATGPKTCPTDKQKAGTGQRPSPAASQLSSGGSLARRAAACSNLSVLSEANSVCEDIFLGPPREVQCGPCRYKIKTGLGHGASALTLQHLVEPRLHLVQVKHVLCRILLLGIAQHMRTPVRALLLLVEFNAEQFLDQVLETVPVGIGAGEFRGQLGAIEGNVSTCRYCLRTATSKRAKWKILVTLGSVSSALRLGAL